MTGHLLRHFQPPSVFQVIGNAGGPEAMAADFRLNACLSAAATDHLMDI